MRFAYYRFARPAPSLTLMGRMNQPRPLATVSLIGPRGIHVDRPLIDTGSDESLFGIDNARAIGIDLTNAPGQTLAGQSGSHFVARFAQVTMRMSDGIENREGPPG